VKQDFCRVLASPERGLITVEAMGNFNDPTVLSGAGRARARSRETGRDGPPPLCPRELPEVGVGAVGAW